LVVEPEGVEDGGVEVADFDRFVDDPEGEVVGAAVFDAALDAAAGEPLGVALGVVVAAVAALGIHGASEFAAPGDLP
jgi:hypothetical protein